MYYKSIHLIQACVEWKWTNKCTFDNCTAVIRGIGSVLHCAVSWNIVEGWLHLTYPKHPFLQDCPEFDLVFDRSFDQWVAGSDAEKCMFIQVLYHACQNNWMCKEGPANPGEVRDPQKPGGSEGRKGPAVPRTNFINCQSKLMEGKAVFFGEGVCVTAETHRLQSMGGILCILFVINIAFFEKFQYGKWDIFAPFIKLIYFLLLRCLLDEHGYLPL